MVIFAQLNENNIVLRVIAVGDDVQTSNGPLSNNPKHIDGENYCLIFGKGPWKQGFEDGTRKQRPDIGDLYDFTNDVFIKPQPYASWTLDSNFDWQPPIAKPNNNELGSDYNLYSRQKTVDFQTNLTNQLWNARLERTFKNDEFTAYILVRDILNQNIGIQRNIYENTITEEQNDRLKRYAMLGFTWNFKNKGETAKK